MTLNQNWNISIYEAEMQGIGMFYLFASKKIEMLFDATFEIRFMDIDGQEKTGCCAVYTDDKDYEQTAPWDDVEFLGAIYTTNVLSIKKHTSRCIEDVYIKREEKNPRYIIDESSVVSSLKAMPAVLKPSP